MHDKVGPSRSCWKSHWDDIRYVDMWVLYCIWTGGKDTQPTNRPNRHSLHDLNYDTGTVQKSRLFTHPKVIRWGTMDKNQVVCTLTLWVTYVLVRKVEHVHNATRVGGEGEVQTDIFWKQCRMGATLGRKKTSKQKKVLVKPINEFYFSLLLIEIRPWLLI